ncbi:MAG: hypothetical protein JW874_04670 [Spirochaetales bacterium]|nr:hypothetical protein [Spirochaetales bacterium]
MKKILWITAAILSPLPALYLYFRGSLYGLAEPYSLAMIFGIAAFVYFAEVLVLSARIIFFDRIFGHDRVMIFHGCLAFTALVLVIIHRQLKKAAFGDLTFLQARIGQAAFFIFLAGILLAGTIMAPGILHRIGFMNKLRNFITRKTPLDYNILKGFHNFLTAAFAVLLVHVLLATSTRETLPRMLFAIIWGGTALMIWVFHKLVRPVILRTHRYSVRDIVRLNGSVTEVRLAGPRLRRQKAGQFVFVRFPGSAAGREEHPFTLSSPPDADHLALTVKNLGNYTSRIPLLKKEDCALVDGPYGIFDLNHAGNRPLVFIAGGIGITPFYAMLGSIPPDDTRAITLFWAVRRKEDLVYDREIRTLTGTLKELRYIPVLSDDNPAPDAEKGYITADLLRKHCSNISEAAVYFCGPAAMRRQVFAGLRRLGVKRKTIHSELFTLG